MKSKNKQYEQARTSMVESQIHPMGVVSEKLLDAFSTVPREKFVPEDKRGVCYCDEEIDVGYGRYSMEASVIARLIEATNPQADDVALNIGSGRGYNASILSHVVSTVVAIDEDEELMKIAQKTWDELGYCNIAVVNSPIHNGAAEHAPYDIIIINGAICEVSDVIKDQLKVGGRIAALIKKEGQPVAKATLITRVEKNIFSENVLFDAGTPYLVGFEPKKEFVF